MPGYIQNPYMPQYGGFQYGNYPMQPNAPYQTPTTYPTFNPQPQTVSNSADALVKSDISGKIVDTENDISVNDIPMDGKVHLFILKDYSKVIGKAWTAEGMARPYLRHDIRGMMDDYHERDESPEEKFESYQKSVKDIWSSATPELRSKMRTTLTKLVNDMA